MKSVVPAAFTRAELEAVLWAVDNIVGGNARDIDEMKLCGFSGTSARALIRAEAKLLASLRKLKSRAIA